MQAGERADQKKRKEGCIPGIQCTVESCEYHSGTTDCTADFIHVGPHSVRAGAGAVCATFNPEADMTQRPWT